MTPGGSVTHWLHQLGDGDADAAQPLWERYFERLVRLARQKLAGTPLRAADEEDVALSAFDSFCRGAAGCRFPQLRDRHNLWAILMVITARKAVNLRKHETRKKRGGGKEMSDAPAPGTADSSDRESPLEEVVGREPSPAFAALVAEEYRLLLNRLPNDDLRQIAVWKMEGYSNGDISAKIKRAEPTVERQLNRIRKFWAREGNR